MKKLFGLILLSSAGLQAAPLIVELGEDHILKGRTSKIWIENAKVISAQSGGSGVVLKPVALGTCS